MGGRGAGFHDLGRGPLPPAIAGVIQSADVLGGGAGDDKGERFLDDPGETRMAQDLAVELVGGDAKERSGVVDVALANVQRSGALVGVERERWGRSSQG